jgi:haloacetate dehalogenase
VGRWPNVEEGGPEAQWRNWADDVSGGALPGGHFFPEASPIETAATLDAFFSGR